MDDDALMEKKKRHLHWLVSHGYRSTGKYTWLCLAVNNVTYKMTLMANMRWYCKCITSWATAFGDGRTPWTAEFKAYKRLGGQNQS